jgi:5'-nucleotidase
VEQSRGPPPSMVWDPLPGATLSYRWAMTFILGVDLDGVCGEYTEALRPIVAAHQGRSPEELPEPASWDFVDWGLDRITFERLHRHAVLEHRIFRTMPVMPGAAEVLWRLSDAGIWIRVITHRLAVNWGHALAVSDTVEWLDEHAIPYRDLCFLGAKPQVEADVYLDDAPHNVVALREEGDEVVVFDAPYNRHLADPRAADWFEVEQLVIAAASRAGHPVQTQLSGMVDPTHRLSTRQARTSTRPSA